MQNLNQSLSKKKNFFPKIFIPFLIILIIAFIAYKTIYKNQSTSPLINKVQKSSHPVQTDTPALVSTSPSPLDEAYIPPTEAVSVTFNMPIENVDEFVHKLEPLTTKYTSKLSNDRKTVTLTPVKSWPVGTTFTLMMDKNTKFLNSKRMENNIIIHFKTVDYQGV